MPAVMPESSWPKWLGEEPATIEELKALLQPYDGDWDMQSEKKANTPPPKKPNPQLDRVLAFRISARPLRPLR